MEHADADAWGLSMAPTHAFVTSCDGCGAFTLIAPSPDVDGWHQVWVVIARVQQDIRDASIRSIEAGCMDGLFFTNSVRARFCLKDAVALFLKPALLRTAQLEVELQDDVKMVVRYLETVGASGMDSRDCNSPFSFVCPLLGLQGIGAGMRCVVGENARANVPECSQDEAHAMFGSDGLSTTWRSELQSWFFQEGDLHEAGVSYELVGSCQGLALLVCMGLSGVEHVVRRVAAMVHHMFILYSTLGDQRAADLFLRERDQISRAAFFSAIFTAMSRRTAISLVESGSSRIFYKECPSLPRAVAVPKFWDQNYVRRCTRAKELLIEVIRSCMDFSRNSEPGFIPSLKDDKSIGGMLYELVNLCYNKLWVDSWMNNLSPEHRPNLANGSLESKLCAALRDRCLRCMGGEQSAHEASIVAIHSLTQQTDLNNRLGIILGAGSQKDRVAVQLLDAAAYYEQHSGNQAPTVASMEEMLADPGLPQATRTAILQVREAAQSRKSLKLCNIARLDSQLSASLNKIIRKSCPKAMDPSPVCIWIAAARLAAEIEIILARAQALPSGSTDSILSVGCKCAAYWEAETLASLFQDSTTSRKTELGKIQVVSGHVPHGALAEWFRCSSPSTLTWTSSAARRLLQVTGGENYWEVTAALEELLGIVMEAHRVGAPCANEVLDHITQWRQRAQDGSLRDREKMVDMAREAKRQQTCVVCGTMGKTRCSGCRAIVYCSDQCAKSDWKQHKKICKSRQVSKW